MKGTRSKKQGSAAACSDSKSNSICMSHNASQSKGQGKMLNNTSFGKGLGSYKLINDGGLILTVPRCRKGRLYKSTQKSTEEV